LCLGISSTVSIDQDIYFVFASITYDGGVVVSIVKGEITELFLFGNDCTASPLPPTHAHYSVHGKITAQSALTSSAMIVGDFEGSGSIIAIGTDKGKLILLDAYNFTHLITWTIPSVTINCIDLSPCTGYIVVGCSSGIVAAIALPAIPSVLPLGKEFQQQTSQFLVNNAPPDVQKVEKSSSKGLLGSLWGKK
jgi:hypothetical protein